MQKILYHNINENIIIRLLILLLNKLSIYISYFKLIALKNLINKKKHRSLSRNEIVKKLKNKYCIEFFLNKQ